MGSSSKGRCISYDYSFKILLIGDSGVGKSSILLSYISNFVHDLSPTIGEPLCVLRRSQLYLVMQVQGALKFAGEKQPSLTSRCSRVISISCIASGVDFKIKMVTVGGKRLKLTIWDTAGQERFGTLTSSYYRGAHGIILVYDVTRRETFTNLINIWAKEVELYLTNRECIKILVGNKVDRGSERAVTTEEGMEIAKEHKSLFLECSARTRENVDRCFRELSSKILEVPSLLENGSIVVKQKILDKTRAHKEVEVNDRGCCH
ncbi:ras-related protein RABC2a-like [Cucumis melo var. makuwa]|uniref:Ras-related protein RABC2a-like n=1 Tax=Cucumis melo var. makuwa TaxID=1194695 RepID=A0A5D3BLP5_CUCMM|nr:ras-related protein RABC2a-like [Cucumis melo var. makuwa]